MGIIYSSLRNFCFGRQDDEKVIDHVTPKTLLKKPLLKKLSTQGPNWEIFLVVNKTLRVPWWGDFRHTKYVANSKHANIRNPGNRFFY